MQRIDENGKIVDILDNETSTDSAEKADEWGAHPIGTIIGAASGAATATLAGAVLGGPAGAVAGAIFGAVAGGLTGNDVAEAVNPKVVDEYWKEHYANHPYATRSNNGYDYYKPAYKFGYEQRRENPNKKFNETEESLRAKWNASAYAKTVDWQTAKEPIRDSFETEEAVYDKRTDSFVVKGKVREKEDA